MSSVTETGEALPRKASKLPLVIGLVLAILGGVGGFLAVHMGLIGAAAGEGTTTPGAQAEASPANAPLEPAAFIPLDPLMVNLPDPSGRRFLRFVAQLEVAPEHVAEVEAIKPRIIDVLNGYLRAVETSELEDPTALMRLRAQMLRRVQVVAGTDRVKDLLIMEFILN